MKRREYGTGQITKVADGRYRLRAPAGSDVVTGKRRVVTETFHGNATDARRRLGELVAEHARHGGGTTTPLRSVIREFLDTGGHARATRANYDRAVARIPDRVLAAPATRLTVRDVDQLIRAVADRHGPHAATQLYALLSGAFTNARRLGWVRDHPVRDAWRPTITRRQSTTPTVAEARRIIAAGADAEQKLWLRLALVLGRRRSEILALRWSDIDLCARTVRVQRALELDRTVKQTKTGDQADIAVDVATARAIASWQNAQRERALASGMPLASDPWLFSQLADSSAPWRPDLATRRWAKTRERAKVRSTIRLQDFRKANTTHLIAGGADVRTVAGRSGHDPAMALGTYAGIVDDANRRAADIIAHVVDG